MAVPVAKKLLDDAQKGERKLLPKERRLVVAFIMATEPATTNVQMGEWFKVTERVIRLDKKYIREEKARFIKEDDVGLIIADIALDFERQVMDIEKNKKHAKKGSKTYLDHCTAIMDLRLKMVKSLQDIGYVPKNLGAMTVKRFDYHAIVDERTGAVQVERSSAPIILEGEIVLPKRITDGNAGGRTGDEPRTVSYSETESGDGSSSATPAETPQEAV